MPDTSVKRTVNTLLFGARVARSVLPRPRAPFKINLMVTSRCNQRCAACRIWTRDAQDLPSGLIRGLLASVPTLSWLDVTGGEVLLRPDIGEVFEAILGAGRRLALLHFPTNGSLPGEAVKAARVAAAGPARLVVTVSLDGPPRLHDALRGREGAWDSAVETFLRLRDLGKCGVLFGMTLSADNLCSYTETLEAAQKAVPGLRAADLHVNIAHASHYYRTEGIKPVDPGRSADVLEAIARARGRSIGPVAVVERRYLRLAPIYLAGGKSPVPCRALAATCFVDVTGSVYPCISWDYPMGNLRDTGGDLMPIWNSPAAARARELIAGEACPGCWTPCEAVPSMLGDFLTPWRRR